jgi:DnaK suppressor protein
MNKSPLSKDFIESQRQVLLALQERLSGHAIVQDPDVPNGSDFGDLSVAVTAAENALTLVTNRQQTLREVSEALLKIQKGIYGICEFTGEPIGEERLEAIPWARYSIEAQIAFEKDGRHASRSLNHTNLFEDSLKTEESEGEEPVESE